MEEYENYIEDTEDNPIIEQDIREVLEELDLNNSSPIDNFYVDRHYYSDGKHKVEFPEDNLILQVKAWTAREYFRYDLKEALKAIKEPTLYLVYDDDLEDLKIISSSEEPEGWNNYFELNENLKNKLIEEVNKLDKIKDE